MIKGRRTPREKKKMFKKEDNHKIITIGHNEIQSNNYFNYMFDSNPPSIWHMYSLAHMFFFSTQSPTQKTSTQCTIETTRHRYTKVSSSVLGAKALLSTCRSLQCTVAPLHTPTQYPCAVHSRLAGSYVMPGESEIHVPLRLRHGFASPRPQQKISKAYKKNNNTTP